MTWNGYDTKKEGLIQEAAEILRQYSDPLTLRQVYYRLVSKNIIENKESQYKYLSKALKEGRLNGTIPFYAIEDRSRAAAGGDRVYIDPERRLRIAWENFQEVVDRQRRPTWENQPIYCEVWVEKQALERIVSEAADRWDVTSFACKGYAGYSSLHQAALRFREHPDQEKHIIYLGDFDPSGKDIERFISDAMRNDFHVDVDVSRIALTREQIEQYQLPPQPAKRSDARFEDFVAKNGNMAVELDALEPPVLKDLIQEAVEEKYDRTIWVYQVKPKQEQEQAKLAGIMEEVKDALESEGVDLG